MTGMEPSRSSAFAEKFLKRLSRIPPEQVEAFLSQVLREKAFLEVVFNALTEGVLVASADHKAVFMNRACGELLGVRPGDAIGRPLDLLLRHKPLHELLDRFMLSGEAIREQEIRIGGTEPRTYLVTVVPVEGGANASPQHVWILNDQTDVIARREEERQHRRIESLATLTAGIAHEIKNPLNSLNIHAQLIIRGADALAAQGEERPETARMRRSAAVITEEIQRLARIVDDFIHAVRPVRLNLHKQDVNALLLSVAELMGPACSERHIELVVEPEPGMPRILVDAEQLRQALLNLAKNALEAIADMVPPRADGRIVLRSLLKPDHVLIEIEDNGAGIPQDQFVKIFEPYHTTKHYGTGLGLMVVYRIVKAHGGAIGITSEVGRGTVFHLALPLDERPVRLLTGQVLEPAPPAAAGAGGQGG